MARYMENPLEVIEAVKDKLAEIKPGLPSRTLEDGTVSKVTVVPFYDRAELINETLATLSTALYQQILITMLVVLLMLRSFGSSVVIAIMLPLGVLGTFVFMRSTGVDANIMALGGIAIAIGTMVDIGIVFVENVTQHFQKSENQDRPGLTIIAEAVQGGRTGGLYFGSNDDCEFSAGLGLNATELRLFAPLAFTKTFAMVVALVLSLIVLPTLASLMLRNEGTSVSADSRVALKRSTWLGVLLVLAGLTLSRFDVFSSVLVILVGLKQIAGPWSSIELLRRVGFIGDNGRSGCLASLLARVLAAFGP